MINAIIMDNEEHFVITLSKIINLHFPEINILTTSGKIDDGAEIIKALKPDLVFLDVEFTNEMGFDLFKHFDNKIDFDVIFISSHSEYAVKAIKYSAFDYILKPVDVNELKNAIERFKTKKKDISIREESINLLLENFKNKSFKKIALTTSRGIRVVNVDSIVRCEADASYCNIHLIDDEKLTITKNSRIIEELLPENIFMRVHKTHLINVNHIKEYIRKDGGMLVMSDNSEIPVAVRKRDIVIDFLKGIND